MKSIDVKNVFLGNKDCTVKVDFNGAFYNVNNIFMKNDILYFRAFELMIKEEKVICDVSYSDEESEMTCGDFIGFIESYDSVNCYYSESFEKARDFNLDILDDCVVLRLRGYVR